jgi:hypothetical protein
MYSKMLFDVRDNIVLHFKSWMFCYKNILLISTHPFTNQKFRNKFKFTKFWFAINFIYRHLVSVFTEPVPHPKPLGQLSKSDRCMVSAAALDAYLCRPDACGFATVSSISASKDDTLSNKRWKYLLQFTSIT